MLLLWKIRQDVNDSYDSYDSAVVAAPDRMSASVVHPARFSDTREVMFEFDPDSGCWRHTFDGNPGDDGSWCRPKDVKVVCIGRASDHLKQGDVVCSSYNAG